MGRIAEMESPEVKMRKETVIKTIYYSVTLLMLFLIIPSILNAQSIEPSRGVIEELLGKWSGTWERKMPQLTGQDFLMEIKKVDPDKSTLTIVYAWTGVRGREPGRRKAKATFIPPEKFEWFTKSGNDFRFQLREGELWGTKRTHAGETQRIVLKKVKE